MIKEWVGIFIVIACLCVLGPACREFDPVIALIPYFIGGWTLANLAFRDND